MEFNIRAISLARGVANDARIDVATLAGKELEFRSGISLFLTLPKSVDAFASITEPEKLLTAIDGWARVYKYLDGSSEMIHVVAPVEDEEGKVAFYRVDMKQKPRPHQRPRPPVEILSAAMVSYDELATWLIDLADKWLSNTDAVSQQLTLQRPRLLATDQLRIAWVGPEVLDGKFMPRRLEAIGRVYGAKILHIAPRSYRDVEARLRNSMPLDGVVICRRFAPQITSDDPVPDKVRRGLVHFCDSEMQDELEWQIRTWAEISREAIEKERQERTSDQNGFLLALMLQGMLNHSKIGQFNHCQKETVLKRIRGRRLNVPVAEQVIDENSEAYHDSRDSDKFFLWKEHGDGRQYFLNSSRIPHCKAVVALHLK